MIAGSLCECEECKVELCSYTGNLMQNRRYEFCGSRGGMSEWRAQAQKIQTRRWTLRIKMFMRIRRKVYCGLFVISLDDRNSEAPKQWSVFVSGPISDSIAAVLGKWSCLVGQRGGIELR